jgi:DNA-binding NarL/FixJ family response regulator
MITSVILFDRQQITRLGLETLVPTECARSSVRTKSELIATLAMCPDAVVVIDYALSDLGGADSLINIGLRFPGVRWILFSNELSVRFLRKVVSEPAFGVVLKHCELAEIRTALGRALDGGIYVCAQVRELLSASGHGEGGEGGPLTATEREILREIVLGRSAKEIAAMRGVSALTVTTHRKNIYRKIEVNNAQEAVRYALRAGVVDASDYFI